MKTEKESWGSVFFHSFGFVLVAIVTALAGYALSGKINSGWDNVKNDFSLIGSLIILLIPYYVSRQALLERQINIHNVFDIRAITLGVQFPITMFFYHSLIVVLILINYYIPPNGFQKSNWWNVALSLLMVVLVFLILSIKSIQDLKMPNNYNAFRFFERVLIPALATGILPFSFGWSISKSIINLWSIFFSCLFVLSLLGIISVKRNKNRLFDFIESHKNQVLIGVFLITFILFLVLKLEEISPIVYGSLITLSMGVSEVSKRVYMAETKDRFFIKGENSTYFLIGSNWSSVIYPILILLVPLFILDLPTLPILIFSAVQSFYWTFINENYKKSKLASGIGILFGYSLPITLILINLYNLPKTYGNLGLGPKDAAFFPSILLAVGGWVINNFYKKEALSFWKSWTKPATYLKKQNVLFLFLFSLFGLVVFVITIGSISNNEILRLKSYDLIIWVSIMIVLVGFLFVIGSLMRKGAMLQNNSENKIPKDIQVSGNIKTQIKWVFISSRPIASFLAGLATLLILLDNNSRPFWIDLIQTLPMFLITMTAFIFNDIYDRNKDMDARIDRPIAKGLLSNDFALKSALLMSFLAVFIALLFNNIYSVNVIIFTFFGVVIYSPFSKRWPILKNVFAAILMLAPIFYAKSTIQQEIPTFLFITILFFSIGREILLDTKDFHGDIKAGIKTIVYYLNIRPSRYLAWGLMLIAVSYYIFNAIHSSAIFFGVLGLFTLFIAFFKESDKRLKLGGITIITMTLCILGIPFLL